MGFLWLMLALLCVVIAVGWFQRRRRIAPGLLCWNCGANLSDERLYIDFKGRSRCPKCGNEMGRDRHLQDAMSGPPQQLDYESRRQVNRRFSLRAAVIFTTLSCFLLSWLVWLVIGLMNYDSFDDSPGMVGFVVAVPGTFCGLLLCLPLLTIIVIRDEIVFQKSRPQQPESPE